MEPKTTTQILRQLSPQFRRGELFRIKGLVFEVESMDLKTGRLHLRTVDEYKTVPAAPRPVEDPALIREIERKIDSKDA